MLVCDATWPDTYAPSHVSVAAREAGTMAAKAEHLKCAKYVTLKVSHLFVPFAVEMSVVLSQAALSLVWYIGHQATGEQHSKEYLFQRIAIVVQRGECCSSAHDLGEAGGSLLGMTEGAPSSLYYCF